MGESWNAGRPTGSATQHPAYHTYDGSEKVMNQLSMGFPTVRKLNEMME